ncbi:MAG: YraN family protein [Robiginitomaculum sp.]|nr:YraN family protein [Robiginitomaculum sp.]
MNKSSRKQAETKGRRAENMAAWLLRLKGYKILDMRHKTPHGEIDLIAKKGNVLAIIEVKRRPSLDQAIEALHSANLSRIEEAAYYYQAKRKNLADLTIRFDAVYVADGLRVKHVKDAWRGY